MSEAQRAYYCGVYHSAGPDGPWEWRRSVVTSTAEKAVRWRPPEPGWWLVLMSPSGWVGENLYARFEVVHRTTIDVQEKAA